MTIHITLAGVLMCIGGAAVTAFVIYVLVMLFFLWRIGK